MQIQFLKEFILLARELNYTRTAQLLFLTQPVLSKHIISLEEELGAQLFIRNKQNVSLTPIGEIFLEDAQKIVSLYDNSINKISLALNGIESTLRIGYLDAAAHDKIISAIQSFSTLFPQTQLQLISFEYGDEIRALENHDIDIAVTLDLDQKFVSKYNTQIIGSDSLAAVLRKDHILAKKDSLSFEALKDDAFVLPLQKQFPGMLDKFQELCKDTEYEYRIEGQNAYKETILLLVEANKCITLMPYHLNGFAGKNLKFIRLTDKAAVFHIIAAFHKSAADKQIISEFCNILTNC